MNCLEFRRISLSEPNSRTEGYLAHRAECEDCARYADSVVALDKKLEDALRIPVPQDLATRIKLRQLMQDEYMSPRFRPWQWAVAASIFLVVAISGLVGYQIYTTNQYIDRLTVAAVDHTRMERQGSHFVAAHEDPVKQGLRFKQVLAAFGGKVMDDSLVELGTIIHVQVCALAHVEGPVAHVLIQGEAGLITIYYVHGHKLKERRSFNLGQYQGMLIPIGNGNMAIIADPKESLSPVADKLEQTVVWQI
ncbi:MAG: DUF3379 family protein [Arenicellales bacterium]|nr:DUF3379 family protein [Arenicellales bacterium]